MPDNTDPTETKKFADAEAKLYTGKTIDLGAGVTVPADYVIVEHSLGNKDEVLIFSHDEVRRVLDVRQTLEIKSSSPAVSASVTGGIKLEPAEPEKEQKLLKIYDQFEARTWR